MDIFKIFKNKKKTVINNPPKGMLNMQAIQHHKIRIDNLLEELYIKTEELKEMHKDDVTPKSIRIKKIDRAVFRMSIIKYEISTRKGLLKWLYL